MPPRLVPSLLLLLLFLFTPVASAQEPEPDPFAARIRYAGHQELERLARELDIWEVHPDQGEVVAMLTSAQMELLQAAGFEIQIDAEKTAWLHPEPLTGAERSDATAGIPNYSCYRTVEETYASLSALAARHPPLATWMDIGDSWEKAAPGGLPGYDLPLLKLTNQAIPGPKPALFLLGAAHAREYATAELASRFAEYLLDGYGVDPDSTWLLDHFELHLLPIQNPDGRKLAETGLAWRKNTAPGCLNPSQRGVDLNRNSSFLWGGAGASPDPCAITYRGAASASEPETRALQNYIAGLFPDRRGSSIAAPAPIDTQGLFITIHSYGELVLWPWGHGYTLPPNSTQLTTLGRKFAFFNGYTAEQSIYLYPTTGAADDWVYGELGVASYTFELGTSFFQSCSTFESQVYPDNLQALLYAFKAARRPYQSPAGPDTLQPAVSSPYVMTGEALTLTATGDAARAATPEPTRRLAGARYSVDLPSWAPGVVLQPLDAADGKFDKKIERLQAAVPTTGLAPGRHMLFVESQDVAGNWGVPSAVFFYVLDPLVSPVIEGVITDAQTQKPISARVEAGSFSTASDPATGKYRLQVNSGEYVLSVSAPGYFPFRLNLRLSDRQVFQQDIALSPPQTLFLPFVGGP